MIVDVVTLLVGIIFTLRKLELRPCEAAELSGVEPTGFDAWKKKQLFVYTLVSTASFGKLLVDYAFQWLARRQSLDFGAVRVVGASLFFGWVAAMVAGAVLGRSARHLARSLGIDMSRRRAPTAH